MQFLFHVQRWAIIRKRHGNMIVGIANSTGPQLSEAQLAARHAMSLALDMPVKNLRTGFLYLPVKNFFLNDLQNDGLTVINLLFDFHAPCRIPLIYLLPLDSFCLILSQLFLSVTNL